MKFERRWWTAPFEPEHRLSNDAFVSPMTRLDLSSALEDADILEVDDPRVRWKVRSTLAVRMRARLFLAGGGGPKGLSLLAAHLSSPSGLLFSPRRASLFHPRKCWGGSKNRGVAQRVCPAASLSVW